MTNTPLKPSEFSDAQVPLCLTDKKLVGAIHKMPFDDFVAKYIAPAPEWDDYLDLRNVPDIWDECMLRLPRSHVFLYAHCLVSSCPELNGWAKVRTEAKAQCRRTGNEAGLLWLNMRPKYVLTMSSSGDRRKFPIWDKRVRGWFVSSARDNYKITARLLLIIYSSKVVLSSSSVDLEAWRPVLEGEVRKWEAWVMGEKQRISEFFSLV